MKTLIFSTIFWGLFANATIGNISKMGCLEKVTMAARSVWSVNSGIDMKFLVGEINGSRILPEKLTEFKVLVNTPKFPNLIQKVPYIVTAEKSVSANTCFIRQVTAVEDYGH